MQRIRNWKPFGGTAEPPATAEKGFVQTMEGGLNTSWDLGWWQQHRQPLNLQGVNETVEACVSALSQTAAMCPPRLQEEKPSGERVRLYGANPERVLHKPNDYETRSLFINNAVRSVYFEGNAYAVAEHDDRGAISALHLMDPKATRGVMDPESGEVFYFASARQNQPFNFDLETDRIFPARKVFHLRLHTNRDPLRGETPIQAAANAIQANSALVGHQAMFFSNMSRPSGVLTTDAELTGAQIKELRQAFNEQAKELESGGMPILARGLKFDQISLSSQDAEAAAAYGMTVAGISRAFRVPLPMINDMSGSTFNNAEAMMNWFLASGLGFLLESMEQEFGRLFNLPFNRKIEMDTRILLRSDWESRIKALGEGTMKGLYSPDEARAIEGLPPVPDGAGAEPRVQQQVIPLSAWEQGMKKSPSAPEETELSEEEAFEMLQLEYQKAVDHVE